MERGRQPRHGFSPVVPPAPTSPAALVVHFARTCLHPFAGMVAVHASCVLSFLRLEALRKKVDLPEEHLRNDARLQGGLSWRPASSISSTRNVLPMRTDLADGRYRSLRTRTHATWSGPTPGGAVHSR